MNISRREFLLLSGLLLLVNSGVVGASKRDHAVVKMHGAPRGERVWFDPIGLAVNPGTTIIFINQDAGNSHTVTAYHPELFGRARRIPQKANPFNSGYMLPGQEFSLTLSVPGIYDYYCLPHEMAAMVGRIVVGTPEMPGWDDSALYAGGVTERVSAQFPSIGEILDAT